jgi:hypothetical protein
MSAAHDLSREYRDAFERYSNMVRRVRQLVDQPNVDPADVDAAVLEMETARRLYVSCRNALAETIQPSLVRASALSDSPENTQIRIRETARLLWEAGGRRDGTQNEDWRRAEEILGRAAKSAVASAHC